MNFLLDNSLKMSGFKKIPNFGQILEIWILPILTIFNQIALNSKPINQFSIWKLLMNPKYLSYHFG